MGPRWCWVRISQRNQADVRFNSVLQPRLCSKSRIVIEYLFRVKETEPKRAIFWASAADASRFLDSYRTVAKEIPDYFLRNFMKLIDAGDLSESLSLDYPYVEEVL